MVQPNRTWKCLLLQLLLRFLVVIFMKDKFSVKVTKSCIKWKCLIHLQPWFYFIFYLIEMVLLSKVHRLDNSKSLTFTKVLGPCSDLLVINLSLWDEL